MKLKDEALWKTFEEVNSGDAYGKACVDVARRVMELIDDGREFETNGVVCQADNDVKTGGITGFMAGCVAEMVSRCHERGEEFRLKWNIDMAITPEDAERTGVINPALLVIKTDR
jgi:hypothetical protein